MSSSAVLPLDAADPTLASEPPTIGTAIGLLKSRTSSGEEHLRGNNEFARRQCADAELS